MRAVFALALLLGASLVAPIQAQYDFHRLSLEEERLLGPVLYSTESHTHTAVKPWRKSHTDTVAPLDTLLYSEPVLGRFSRTWVGRKLLNERLVQVRTPDFDLSLDPVVDLTVGRESNANLWVNTRGVLAEGRIGRQVRFQTSWLESQAVFPEWVRQSIDSNGIVPGNGIARPFGETGADFNIATGMLSYTPSRYFNISFGHGRNFFGEGYRSMFLSDASFNYPHLRIETTVWKIKYINLYNWMSDLRPEVAVDGVYKRKYTAMHYLSLDLGDRWNLGLFEAVIWGDSVLQRGFDVDFINPIIFYNAIEFARGSRGGNSLVGFSASYKIQSGWMAYGQFLFDELSTKDIAAASGSWKNKFGYQIGSKWYEPLGWKGGFVRLEYNAARPYTYSHKEVLSNHAHYGQPLAHHWGGNFREGIVEMAYDRVRYGASVRYHYGRQGNDSAGVYYGRDVYTSYTERPYDDGHFIAQDNPSTMHFVDARAYWTVNPPMRLRLEVWANYRSMRFDQPVDGLYEDQSQWALGVGLRTVLFNRYFDF
ncbi:hypothetical protein GC167_09515 [bacterium]|nr:hypothetical protein [bacterium]